MSRVAQVLGVARSNLHERVRGRSRPRGPYRKAEDAELLPLIRRVVDERPTYGYRRVTALVNRELRRQGAAPANHKRIYRIMKRHALLRQRRSGRREGRVHDGRIVVMRSNRRWCSDVLEFTCWNGEIVLLAFVIDAHDREVLASHAVSGAGIGGDVVRDLMLEAVEARFGALRAPAPIEFLSDNRSSADDRSDPQTAARSRRADGQRLHRQADPRFRHGAHLGAMLHARAKSGIQRPRRGLREDLQARRRSREPAAGRRHRGCADPGLDRRLQ